jgi:hypothetical protein
MNGKKTIEDYLIDLINQKYAKRVFSQLVTEHEKKYLELGQDPDYREYDWMVNRALEIHKALNLKDNGNAKETKD